MPGGPGMEGQQGGQRGIGKAGWGGGLTEMTHFKIRLLLWIGALVAAKLYGAETAVLIAIGIFLGGIIALSHTWKMSGGRQDPRLVSVMVTVSAVLGALLMTTLSAGVPKVGPWTDKVARSAIDVPDPNVNLNVDVQNPLTQSPVVAAPTSTLPAIPAGQ